MAQIDNVDLIKDGLFHDADSLIPPLIKELEIISNNQIHTAEEVYQSYYTYQESFDYSTTRLETLLQSAIDTETDVNIKNSLELLQAVFEYHLSYKNIIDFLVYINKTIIRASEQDIKYTQDKINEEYLTTALFSDLLESFELYHKTLDTDNIELYNLFTDYKNHLGDYFYLYKLQTYIIKSNLEKYYNLLLNLIISENRLIEQLLEYNTYNPLSLPEFYKSVIDNFPRVNGLWDLISQTSSILTLKTIKLEDTEQNNFVATIKQKQVDIKNLLKELLVYENNIFSIIDSFDKIIQLQSIDNTDVLNEIGNSINRLNQIVNDINNGNVDIDDKYDEIQNLLNKIEEQLLQIQSREYVKSIDSSSNLLTYNNYENSFDYNSIDRQINYYNRVSSILLSQYQYTINNCKNDTNNEKSILSNHLTLLEGCIDIIISNNSMNVLLNPFANLVKSINKSLANFLSELCWINNALCMINKAINIVESIIDSLYKIKQLLDDYNNRDNNYSNESALLNIQFQNQTCSLYFNSMGAYNEQLVNTLSAEVHQQLGEQKAKEFREKAKEAFMECLNARQGSHCNIVSSIVDTAMNQIKTIAEQAIDNIWDNLTSCGYVTPVEIPFNFDVNSGTKVPNVSIQMILDKVGVKVCNGAV